MISGKQKIAAYAPAPVVKALASLEITHIELSNQQTQTAMLEFIKSTRKSVSVGSNRLDVPIHQILFSAEVVKHLSTDQ